MSKPPGKAASKAGSKAAGKRAPAKSAATEDDAVEAAAPARAEKSTATASSQSPLAKRLPGMSDYQLNAYIASANRIGLDPKHPKHAASKETLALIEAEVRRRANGTSVAPPKNEASANPKTGKSSAKG